MKKERFDELLESIYECIDIIEGKAKPARVHYSPPPAMLKSEKPASWLSTGFVAGDCEESTGDVGGFARAKS